MHSINEGEPSVAPTRRHISGLWLGESVPAAEHAHDVATNPINFSLTLLEPKAAPPGHPPSAAPSLYGSGFFDDAGDIANSPVLFFLLRGSWEPSSGAVQFVKTYEHAKVSSDLCVRYVGKVRTSPSEQPTMTGTWRNELEGTHGTFACRLEETCL